MEQANRTLELRDAERIQQLSRQSRELSASKTMLRAVLDGIHTLVILLDAHGSVVDANQVALGAIGATIGDVAALPFESTKWCNRDASLADRNHRAIDRAAEGEIVSMNVTHCTLSGGTRTVDFTITPYRNASGAIVWLAAEGRDVTDSQRMEVERDDLEQRLHHSERLETVGRLTGGVAHDFNNLLTVLGNGIDSLRTGDGPERFNLDILDDMDQAVRSVTAMTRQLVAFSRKQATESEIISVDERTSRIAMMWRRVLSNAIDLSVEFNAPSSQVRMPIGQFEQVLVNLIVNAQDSMPQGGAMILRTEIRVFDSLPCNAFGQGHAQGPHVVTTLTDTGCGMNSETLRQAFDLYYTTKSKGTGFGLATVYGMVTRAGGFITLDSTQGEGTSVGICLPLLDELEPVTPRAPVDGFADSAVVAIAPVARCM